MYIFIQTIVRKKTCKHVNVCNVTKKHLKECTTKNIVLLGLLAEAFVYHPVQQ